MLLYVIVCSPALDAAAAQRPVPPAVPPQPAQAPPAEQSVPPYRARVLGLYDEASGDPIANAKISDFLSGSSALTNSAGLVSLIFLPDGGSLVQIQKLGYEPQTVPVAISPSDTAPLTLLMRPVAAGRATRLPGVSIAAAAAYLSPAMRGFQERKNSGAAGYFIDDTTLRNNESRQLADLMRSRLPSVNLGGNGRGTSLLKSFRCVSTSSAAPGPPQVFLDGVPLVSDPSPTSAGRRPPPPRSIPFDLSRFQVSDLAGVEWYPSTDQAPIGYAGTSERCGVLLLWTRER
ncbi:MAG: carboxypeptidase-like regulatory domain-containing protein [Tepidiformaceae bacterium]